jgi:peroxiredoxin
VAIVAQKPAAVQAWLQEHALPFALLIDESRDTLRAYGVWHRIGFDAWNISRPALFLIKPGRAIVRSFVASNQREFPTHPEILSWIASPYS